MKKAPAWRKAKFVGEIKRKNKPYYISKNTLYKDPEEKTIWIDLKEEGFYEKQTEVLNLAIKRVEFGSNQDFELMNLNFAGGLKFKAPKLLSDIAFWILLNKENKEVLSIPDKVLRIKGIMSQIQQAKEQGQDVGMPKIMRRSLELKENDFEYLDNIEEFIDELQEKEMTKLIADDRYSLLIGELTLEQSIDNKVATEIDNIKKPDINPDNAENIFKDVVLKEELKTKIYDATGLGDIIAGVRPKVGGAILIDHGGTGKSLMKKNLKKLFKEMTGDENSVKEKSQGDITSYVNAGPQLIQKWYRGGPKDEVTGDEEVDLVAQSKKVGIPSLLVIDEAEEFIREKKDGKDSVNALNTLKKYIQDISKGGVTGHVITLLIANMDPEEIHAPLGQGSERLSIIYLGFPQDAETWEKIFEIAFKEKINFDSQNYIPQVLADLLLKHNETCTHERFGVSPRRIMAYVDEFISRYAIVVDSSDSSGGYFHRHANRKKKVVKQNIDFKEFINHFINDVLKEKVYQDSELKNKENVFNSYLDFLHQFEGDQSLSFEDRNKKRQEKQLLRQQEIMKGALIQEYSVIYQKLIKFANNCSSNSLLFQNEGQFLVPLSNVLKSLISFRTEFLHDINLKRDNRQIEKYKQNIDMLIELIQRIENRQIDFSTDLMLFVRLVNSLPKVDDLFEKVKISNDFQLP